MNNEKQTNTETIVIDAAKFEYLVSNYKKKHRTTNHVMSLLDACRIKKPIEATRQEPEDAQQPAAVRSESGLFDYESVFVEATKFHETLLEFAKEMPVGTGRQQETRQLANQVYQFCYFIETNRDNWAV